MGSGPRESSPACDCLAPPGMAGSRKRGLAFFRMIILHSRSMVTNETTHPPWSRRFTAKRYGRGLSIDAAAQLMGVSAEEFARLEQQDPEFRALLADAKET